jgi:hypothetical protein
VVGKFFEDGGRTDPNRGTRYFLGETAKNISVRGFPEGSIFRSVDGTPPKGSLNFLDLPQDDFMAIINKHIDRQRKLPENAKLHPDDILERGWRHGTDEFWRKYNLPYLAEAFKRGDNVRLVSDPYVYIRDSIIGGTYKRELEAIGYSPTRELLDGLAKKYGYVYDELSKIYKKK